MSRFNVSDNWRQCSFLVSGILFTGAALAAMFYFWDEIQDAAGYGYAGCFLVTTIAGMTLWPASGLPVVFTLAHKLGPLFVGLVAGLGEALGGITEHIKTHFRRGDVVDGHGPTLAIQIDI